MRYAARSRPRARHRPSRRRHPDEAVRDRSARRRDGRTRLEVTGADFRMPPGGILFMPPGIAQNAAARIGGRREPLHDGRLRIRSLPAVVEIE